GSENLLTGIPSEPFQEYLCFRRMLARRQHRAARHANECARVFVTEVVQSSVVAVFSGPGLIAEIIIMVDHRTFDLAAIDSFQRRDVAAKWYGILFHCLKPGCGRSLPFNFEERAHDSLEIRAGRRSAPAAFPVRSG